MDNINNLNMSAPPIHETNAKYSGFWRRFFAYIIDALIIAIVTAACIIAPLVFIVANGANGRASLSFVYLIEMSAIFVIFLLYDSIFLSLGTMATPGKLVLGIKVTDLNGNRLSFPRALLRTIFKFGFSIVSVLIPVLSLISLVVLLNPFLIVLTEKKQAIHDFIAGTVVVQK